ncbi:MAG: DUF1573 domain-containing protein [Nitrospirae bacterium]|nr:MAG: DUF1573 domain-containing protein [Nitrospirota bacterium]
MTLFRTLALGLAATLLAAAAWAGPHVAVEAPVYDFGTVLQGDKVVHRFVVKNTGDATLEIHKVKTTCGCTVARDYPREIAPGESGELTVTFDTSHKRGRQVKGITLFTNAEPSPQYVLQVKGVVRELLALSPVVCNFGTVPQGQTAVRELTLTNNSDREVHLTVAEPADAHFKVSLDQASLAPGASAKVKIAFTATTERPVFANLAEIRTDLPRVPVVTIRILARVQLPKPEAG